MYRRALTAQTGHGRPQIPLHGIASHRAGLGNRLRCSIFFGSEAAGPGDERVCRE
jgi:hypothetical protein